MRMQYYRAEKTPRLMIIPMIDVIFFLLVFFMMSTLHMVYQKSIVVNLPKAALAQQEQKTPIAITVTAEGNVYLGDQAVALPSLRGAVKSELARKPQAVVVLKADSHAEHGKIVAVIDELKAANVEKLSIATESQRR